MVTCIKYESVHSQVWDDFIASCKTPLFFFNRGFLEYHSDCFIDASLMFYEKDVLVAVLPATLHNNVLNSHGGVTYGGLLLSLKIKTELLVEVLEALRDWAISFGIVKIIYKAIPYIFQIQPSQEDLYFLHNLLGAKLIRRDLSSVIYLQDRMKLSKGRKWLVARAKKNELKVIVSDNWVDFHRLLSSVLVKHDTIPVHSVADLQLLAKRFPKNIVLNAVFQGGDMIAAALFFKFSNVVHTQYLASNDLGKDLGALDMIIEESIQENLQDNYQYFNFGISTEQAGKVLNAGLISQKETFGARGMCIDFYEINFDD
ncbi:GNAT family N-acetyltransferase [Pseudomonas sp. CCC3.2]|uniref:GNAT family N-acetyltransferase n=1 Tax=unclassified Pseudomonas TaxID=196821 RepID=UPI002AB3A62B|nr:MULTISPECIES: GNAT family N-acetyltransferase [unclassified Pseudomonas]MDY7561401.1 GNAT family N-acetyltransferase [Pseudomonas sp. AB6]MEB0178933.1 GNAT family N-acetyltransferase [Pseudomonas sp. CCC3.2]MEB0210197.1 GNAT family N-acetyltransferase [Pseudomonas sp. AB6]